MSATTHTDTGSGDSEKVEAAESALLDQEAEAATMKPSDIIARLQANLREAIERAERAEAQIASETEERAENPMHHGYRRECQECASDRAERDESTAKLAVAEAALGKVAAIPLDRLGVDYRSIARTALQQIGESE